MRWECEAAASQAWMERQKLRDQEVMLLAGEISCPHGLENCRPASYLAKLEHLESVGIDWAGNRRCQQACSSEQKPLMQPQALPRMAVWLHPSSPSGVVGREHVWVVGQKQRVRRQSCLPEFRLLVIPVEVVSPEEAARQVVVRVPGAIAARH